MGRTADRALGTFAADGYGGKTEYFGVRLQNGTGSTVSGVQIDYVIKQWRRDENPTTWTLQHFVTSSDAPSVISDDSGFVAVADSTISSATGSAGGLNGNREGNVTPFDLTIDELSWEAGDYLWLRWTNDQSEKSGGLGLDNLTVTAIKE